LSCSTKYPTYSVLRSRYAFLHHSVICGAAETKKMSEEFIQDAPVKYSQSKAYDYSTFDSFEAPKRDWPWYQSHVVRVSLAVFLIYFLALREENDLDEQLTVSLYETVPGLEEADLRTAIHRDASMGKDTTELRARLAELLNKEK